MANADETSPVGKLHGEKPQKRKEEDVSSPEGFKATMLQKWREVGIVLVFLLPLILLVAAVLFAALSFPTNTIKFSLSVIGLCGASGGLLFAMRQSRVTPPKVTNGALELGSLADCGYGIAGAIVIFVVTPGLSEDVPGSKHFNSSHEPITEPRQNAATQSPESNDVNTDWLEIMAVALVGGYAGRAMMQKASDAFTEVKKVEQQVETLHTTVDERLSTAEQQIKAQSRAIELVEQQLDLEEPPVDVQELDKILQSSDYHVKKRLYMHVKRSFVGDPPTFAQRSIPILQALVRADPSDQHCNSRAILARCLGETGDWESALQWIRKAIEIRDAQELEGLERYDEFLARCLVELCPHFRIGEPSTPEVSREIVKQLAAAYPQSEPPYENCGNDRIQEWLARNSFVADDNVADGKPTISDTSE